MTSPSDTQCSCEEATDAVAGRLQLAVLTLFPELFEPFLSTSFVGKARKDGILGVHLEHLRDHGLGVHKSVDDTPYGGGAGMVMRVDCVVAAIEAAEAQCRFETKAHRVVFTPSGRRFTQAMAHDWVKKRNLLLICGRYEGFDERVREFVDEEVSIGDFVLMGGELPAMVIIEACTRLIDGVLGNRDSTREESFSEERAGMLEYPQYTRPATFRDFAVPDVLRSGDHARIREWREQQAEDKTRATRPDLLGSASRRN